MSTAQPSPKGKSFSGPVVIDPVTRVEGHNKIRVEVKDGVVTDAWSTVSMFRGLEIILKGRRPEDAPHFTQRACGVCTNTHALASLRAVEDAAGVVIPDNARLIRHLLLSALMMHDHIVHFYHLHGPDWFDMASALSADPAKAAREAEHAGYHAVKAEDLAAVQKRLKAYVDAGQLGFLENAMFLGGHPSYRLTPEMNLVMSTNYLVALQVQRRLGQAMAIFGGKNPHSQAMIVGGVTCYNALNKDSVDAYAAILAEATEFCEGRYLPDIVLLGKTYPEWAAMGGNDNFLATADYRDREPDGEPYFPSGVLFGRDYKTLQQLDATNIREHVAHSWYEGVEERHPTMGETKPKFTSMDDPERYSWTKAPRYDGQPMEVGPLARVLVQHAAGKGDLCRLATQYLKNVGLTSKALFSTLGRTAARCLETVALARRAAGWVDELRGRIASGDTTLNVAWKMPDTAHGVGWVCVPRGALSHWLSVKGGRIDNFQMVVPSTWNSGPRCAAGKRGPVENSLVGNTISDPDRPVEMLRTVHSFDPCLACSVHLITPDGQETGRWRIL